MNILCSRILIETSCVSVKVRYDKYYFTYAQQRWGTSNQKKRTIGFKRKDELVKLVLTTGYMLLRVQNYSDIILLGCHLIKIL